MQLNAVDPAAVRFAAMNLLARREHSQRELRQKLKRRFKDETIVDEQIQRLCDETLQSDQRFAVSFLRQRLSRGQGPQRILYEMRQRGIPDAAVNTVMEDESPDWFELAAEVIRHKYGDQPASDLKEKAKRARFMQYRGFLADHYVPLLD